MESLGDSPPFWPQPPISAPRRRSSSPLLPPPILIILVPLLALLLLFFLVPPFISASSHILSTKVKVKRSWDSLNVLLVLFAILCGIFARRNDVDEDNTVMKVPSRGESARESDGDRWLGQENTKTYDSPARPPVIGGNRLRRNSSSYPDLRQEYPQENVSGDDRFRFFDDFDIDKFRTPELQPAPLRRWRDESEIKVIPVDTFVLRSSPSPPASPPPQSSAPKSPAPPPPPPPPPPLASNCHKQRRTYEDIGTPSQPPPPPPRPPPIPPPSAATEGKTESRPGRLERRKSNATKEIKMVIASVLRNQRKRKKKQKSRTIHENANQTPPEDPQYFTRPPAEDRQYFMRPPPSPIPPPPPPPPPSFFHSLFRKSSKSKRIHSVSQPPPPPPPPPRPFSAAARQSKRKNQTSAPPPPPPPPPTVQQPERFHRREVRQSGKPPLPTKARISAERDESVNVNSGSQSPLIPIPPPPPPPFKLPELRFVESGDFVRIRSNLSSRCSSPELEDADDLSSSVTDDPSGTVDQTDGGDGGGARIFCPSPDVNVKADTFIARLRDGWRLEKMNSLREKVGPGPSPIGPS